MIFEGAGLLRQGELFPGMFGSIKIEDDLSSLEVDPTCTSVYLNAHLSKGAHVRIGPYCRFSTIQIYNVGGRVDIGERCGFNNGVQILLHEGKSVSIGNHSLFGPNVVVSSSDMHSILDVASGARINPAADIHIGDRVWISQSCFILKGAKIGAGNIVGAASVVTSHAECGENLLLAGNPARVAKRGVTWDHRLLPVQERALAPLVPDFSAQ